MSKASDIKDMSKELLEKIQKAKETLSQQKKALNDIKDEISGIAADIAGAVIQREVSPEEHSEIVDAFIRDLDAKD